MYSPKSRFFGENEAKVKVKMESPFIPISLKATAVFQAKSKAQSLSCSERVTLTN
jgi:hypothetical protein